MSVDLLEPYKNQTELRVRDYQIYEKIFLGEHFDAFSIKTDGYHKKDFDKLRYIAVNFGGMISKLSADMIFEEFPKITTGDNDEFVSALIKQNQLKTQFYESALENSFRGDAFFRIRAKDSQVIIEDVNAEVVDVEYQQGNVRMEPEAFNLKWEVEVEINGSKEKALFIERHTKGQIENNLYQLEGDGSKGNFLPLDLYDADLEPIEETGVEDSFLVVHIPNYKINSSYYGISDYKDLLPLMHAINNRISKVDNILDKHGDPILAVPEGVLDDEGKVSRKMFGVIEVPTDEASGSKPEYIVWDAKLESAFSEIEKLIDLLFMVSETSPASIGIEKEGKAESGRALKFKLLRTIAKKHRKELYFDWGIKKLLKTAQEFAKNNKFKAGDVSCGKVEDVSIEWMDGIINDEVENLDIEISKIENKLTTRKDAIQRIEGINEKEAEEKLEIIEKEAEKDKPDFNQAPNLNNKK